MEGSEGEVVDCWKIIRNLEEQLEEWRLKCDEQEKQNQKLLCQLVETRKRKKALLAELNQALVEKNERFKRMSEQLERRKNLLQRNGELKEMKREVEEMEERKEQLEAKKTLQGLALEEQQRELREESTLKALTQQLEEEEEEYKAAGERIRREAKLWREQVIESLNTAGDNEVEEETSRLLRKERVELRRWEDDKLLLEEQRERFEQEVEAEQQVVGDLDLKYGGLKERINSKKAEMRGLREQEQQNSKSIQSLREELEGCSAARKNSIDRIRTFRDVRPSRSRREELQAEVQAARSRTEQLEEAQQEAADLLRDILQESDQEEAERKTGRLLQFLDGVAPPPKAS